MTLDHVRTILDELHCKKSTEKLEAIYSLDLNGTLEACQNDEIEALVKARYGDQGYKIFRLLSMRGQLIETDRIAEITFVEKKEAHQMLYRLWKDEYIKSKARGTRLFVKSSHKGHRTWQIFSYGGWIERRFLRLSLMIFFIRL
ncbi:uncharacterized protein LOC144551183 [Carex rostrata]